MAEFLETSLGIATLIAAQSLLVVGFVIDKLIFLCVCRTARFWAAVQMRRRVTERRTARGLACQTFARTRINSSSKEWSSGRRRPLYFLAPLASLFLGGAAWAVIRSKMVVLADINVAILFVHGDCVLGSLRRHHGRLGIELEICLSLVVTVCGTDDFVRGLAAVLIVIASSFSHRVDELWCHLWVPKNTGYGLLG